MWKVYRIDDGRIVKAGFDSDDQAKDWLERRPDLAEDEYDVEEMDEEEIAEFTESEDDEDEGVYSRHATKVGADDDDDFAGGDVTDIDYGDGDDDEDDADYDEDEEDEDEDEEDDDY